ncbi:hypothetical protein [Pseudomonas azerbaijanoccidentalis]
MDAFDDLILGYALKKLTDVFEEILDVSIDTSMDKGTGAKTFRQGKASKKLSAWLKCLRANSAYQVTHVLIDQMHAVRKLNNTPRFEAQVALLDALVEDGLAMHVASYTVAIVENRLKCFY